MTTDTEHARRMWALENVKRSKEVRCPDHPLACDVTCLKCVFDLGRSVGHVEAGAYWTHGEVMERMVES